jgi:hypothetical protein
MPHPLAGRLLLRRESGQHDDSIGPSSSTAARPSSSSAARGHNRLPAAWIEHSDRHSVKPVDRRLALGCSPEEIGLAGHNSDIAAGMGQLLECAAVSLDAGRQGTPDGWPADNSSASLVRRSTVRWQGVGRRYDGGAPHHPQGCLEGDRSSTARWRPLGAKVLGPGLHEMNGYPRRSGRAAIVPSGPRETPDKSGSLLARRTRRLLPAGERGSAIHGPATVVAAVECMEAGAPMQTPSGRLRVAVRLSFGRSRAPTQRGRP